jgi:hypothetical protein
LQAKGDLLKRGFALMVAVVFMILMATLLSLSLDTSAQNSKSTSDIFIKEQMELLGQSGVEYALLRLSASKGLAQVDISYEQNYEINVTITPISSMQTIESNGTALFDTFVTYDDGSRRYRFHRRTLQKP